MDFYNYLLTLPKWLYQIRMSFWDINCTKAGNLTERIFDYLYNHQKSRGKGYLFRPNVKDPERHTVRLDWMRRFKWEFEFLSEKNAKVSN